MQNLTRAHDELFRRTPDECFESIQTLWVHCHGGKQRSTDRWVSPTQLRPQADGHRLLMDLGVGGSPFALNWPASALSLDKELQRSLVQNKEQVYRSLADTMIARGRLAEAEQGIEMPRDPQGYAQRLYQVLHEADALSLDWIAVEMPPDSYRCRSGDWSITCLNSTSGSRLCGLRVRAAM